MLPIHYTGADMNFLLIMCVCRKQLQKHRTTLQGKNTGQTLTGYKLRSLVEKLPLNLRPRGRWETDVTHRDGRLHHWHSDSPWHSPGPRCPPGRGRHSRHLRHNNVTASLELITTYLASLAGSHTCQRKADRPLHCDTGGNVVLSNVCL